MIDFEDFTPETFSKHPLVIICVATHYEGDPCDNSKKFYKWFKEQHKGKEANSSLLKEVNYAIFGLGDTSYEQFNAIGKHIDTGMEELGAKRIYKYGEGNAEKNKTEDDFIEWKEGLWASLAKHYSS